jgi:hypothetical protein
VWWSQATKKGSVRQQRWGWGVLSKCLAERAEIFVLGALGIQRAGSALGTYRWVGEDEASQGQEGRGGGLTGCERGRPDGLAGD